MVDVILNYYFYLAKKETIDFTVSGKLTGKTGLEMFDITTLMGNLLQNALEAAVQTTIPKIRVELIEHKKEIFIVVSNSVAEEMNTPKGFLGTSKADADLLFLDIELAEGEDGRHFLNGECCLMTNLCRLCKKCVIYADGMLFFLQCGIKIVNDMIEKQISCNNGAEKTKEI